ncbi:Uncharacterized protein family, UPF0114 [Musa troglodytarum]|uniref:Uncharacterized protein family, UPF0114 n=1 Tax=Musa troglodytarum TaxID=320322 RepID=A0A9E7GIS0_9LILI|nr:Uncharacterized protein family, UPF0114 [Musa troglodytarum]
MNLPLKSLRVCIINRARERLVWRVVSLRTEKNRGREGRERREKDVWSKQIAENHQSSSVGWSSVFQLLLSSSASEISMEGRREEALGRLPREEEGGGGVRRHRRLARHKAEAFVCRRNGDRTSLQTGRRGPPTPEPIEMGSLGEELENCRRDPNRKGTPHTSSSVPPPPNSCLLTAGDHRLPILHTDRGCRISHRLNLGCFFVLESYCQYFQPGMDQGGIVQPLVEAIDMFLVGTALLTFGISLYVMFASSEEMKQKRGWRTAKSCFGSFNLKKLADSMEMQSISHAKSRLGHAVLLILQTGVVDKFKNVQLASGMDLACFAAAVFVSSACVFLLSKLSMQHSKNEQDMSYHVSDTGKGMNRRT